MYLFLYKRIKTVSVYFVLILISFSVRAQTQAEDIVKDNSDLDEVDFKLFSAFGHCDITSTSSNSLSVIYGDYDDGRIGYEIKNQTLYHTKKVELDIKGKKPSAFSFFNASEVAHSDWNIYLSKNKNLNLDLTFGHGDADIQLSGMHLKNLHILNSKADVNLSYKLGQANPIEMDSVILDVKSGHLKFDHIEMAKAHVVDVSVDFGEVEIDFEHKTFHKMEVNAHVNGGKFIVHLPKGDVPVLIKFNQAEFSTIHIPEGYVKTKEGYYKSSSYKSGVKNPIIFNLDLTIGSTVDLLVL